MFVFDSTSLIELVTLPLESSCLHLHMLRVHILRAAACLTQKEGYTLITKWQIHVFSPRCTVEHLSGIAIRLSTNGFFHKRHQ